jgi:hypothetical protein
MTLGHNLKCAQAKVSLTGVTLLRTPILEPGSTSFRVDCHGHPEVGQPDCHGSSSLGCDGHPGWTADHGRTKTD